MNKSKQRTIRSLGVLAISCGLACGVAFGAEGTKASTFRPGELWPDNHGVHINAHGGGILLYGGTYYWFGEHKISGPRGNSAMV